MIRIVTNLSTTHWSAIVSGFHNPQENKSLPSMRVFLTFIYLFASKESTVFAFLTKSLILYPLRWKASFETLSTEHPSSRTCATNNFNNMTPRWYQKTISITAPSRGCHLITSDIVKAVKDELASIQIGMANIFIKHTSASLTINENADPDVRRDMEVALNRIVPSTWARDGTFHHTLEGDDDMPGHVKSSIMGVSLNIPIQNGRLALGTWQGIYLNEHRDNGGWGGGHERSIVITLQGQS